MRHPRAGACVVLAAVLAAGGCAEQPGGQRSEPVVTVDLERVAPGQDLEVSAAGFPAGAEVVIGAGPVESEYEVLARSEVAGDGSVRAQVTIPPRARPGRTWVVVVEVPGRGGARAVSGELRIVEPDDAGRSEVTVTGRLTDEGVECQALRGDDGGLYTLTGELGGAVVGDRVRVSGVPAEMSFCMQGTTLDVVGIERLD